MLGSLLSAQGIVRSGCRAAPFMSSTLIIFQLDLYHCLDSHWYLVYPRAGTCSSGRSVSMRLEDVSVSTWQACIGK